MDFSCLCCCVKFAAAEMQRNHYKTDWHRYNLKRKIIDLAPLTAEEFDSYVIKSRLLANETKINLYCEPCSKQFGNDKSFHNHLNSKKHEDNVKFNATPKTTMTQIDCEMRNGDINPNQMCEGQQSEGDCIFCDHCSNDMVDNLAHMSSVHSFFIPDAEFCTDVKALVHYLQQKVSVLFFCLWCNGKQFRSLSAARMHMIEKGHCQMNCEMDEMEEYSEYYDYSSSYPDNVEGMDIDEEIIPDYFDGDEYELVLPSGASIGHRSLLRYYKQRLNPNPSTAKLPSLTGTNSKNCVKNNPEILRRRRDEQLMARILAKTRLHISLNGNNVKKQFRT